MTERYLGYIGFHACLISWYQKLRSCGYLIFTICIFQHSFLSPTLSKVNVIFNVGDVVKGVLISRWVWDLKII